VVILKAGDIRDDYKYEFVLEEGERLVGIRSEVDEGVEGDHFAFRFVVGRQQ
jgi:hypothetical protein